MSEGRKLDDWIDSYMQYDDASEAPASFKKWCAISTIAAHLQRKCFLLWEGILYPNLYIVLVGPSGCRKTTAMRSAQSFLRRTGIHLSPEAVTREQLIRRLKKANSDFVDDAGKPGIHSCLTVFSEELTVFLGYNNIQLMSDLCNWFDCPNPWSYETKNMGQDNIVNVWVNLIGGTTPKLLRSTLPQDTVGGGLSSRIIFIYESSRGKINATPFRTEKDIILGEQLFNDIQYIYLTSGEYKPTEDFIQCWKDWYSTESSKPPFTCAQLEDYLTRRGTHVLKLSMIMNASRKDGDMILNASDFKRALHELEMVEKKMPNVFIGVGKNESAGVTADVMRTIGMKKVISFNELLGLYMHDADIDTLKGIIATLSTMRDANGRSFCKYNPLTGIIEYTQ